MASSLRYLPRFTRDSNELTVHVVGWSNSVPDASFGASAGADPSIKSKLINLMTSVRTLMRSTFFKRPSIRPIKFSFADKPANSTTDSDQYRDNRVRTRAWVVRFVQSWQERFEIWCIIRWREENLCIRWAGFRVRGYLYALKAFGKGEGERRISIRYLSEAMQNTLL
jgi:hypothetical protein